MFSDTTQIRSFVTLFLDRDGRAIGIGRTFIIFNYLHSNMAGVLFSLNIVYHLHAIFKESLRVFIVN